MFIIIIIIINIICSTNVGFGLLRRRGLCLLSRHVNLHCIHSKPTEPMVNPLNQICLEDAGESLLDILVSPCACRGSNQYIHKSCLTRWHVSLGNPNSLNCPTCKQVHTRI